MPKATVFGEQLSVSSRSAILPASLKAMLKRSKDLRCILTAAFDGMTDIKEPVNQDVSPSWVIERLLMQRSKTRSAFITRRLGAEVISLSNASYDVLITDKEYRRRATLLASLPMFTAPEGQTLHTFHPGIEVHPYPSAPVRSMSLGALLAKRAEFLASLSDPCSFDDGVMDLRALTEPDQLAAFLHHRGHIRLAAFAA